MDQAARIIVTGLALTAAFACTAAVTERNFKPKEGYVPDARTAIKIAVAVWEPIYGVGEIVNEQPYHASLTNGGWTVHGSLPKGRVGGAAIAGNA